MRKIISKYAEHLFTKLRQFNEECQHNIRNLLEQKGKVEFFRLKLY